MVDRCPPEILVQIFALACLDDGKTGCSLSAVSTRVHDISKPYRYQSVKLSGIAQMKRFIDSVLDTKRMKQEAQCSLGVKYLFLQSRSPFRDPGFYETTSQAEVIRNRERPLTNKEVLSFTLKWRTQFIPVLQRIIETFKSELVMLHLETQSALFSLESYTFPALEEFHVLANVDYDWTKERFPRLRRIRLPEFAHTFLERSSIPTLQVMRIWARTPTLSRVLSKDVNDDGLPLCVHTVQRVLLELQEGEQIMKEGIKGRFQDYGHIVLVPSRKDLIEEDWWDSVSGGQGCFTEM